MRKTGIRAPIRAAQRKNEMETPTLAGVDTITTSTDRERAERSRIRRQVESNWAEEIESMAFSAKIFFARYDSFVKAGFTPEQALLLCK